MNKKGKNIVDKAIDASFSVIAKESGMKPMDLFMVGIGYVAVGLLMVNTGWLPASLRVLGGFIIVSGLAGMVLIARKL